jgi:hypothetical protein
MIREAFVVAAAVVLAALSGCESTQEQSKKLAREGRSAFTAKGLTIGARSTGVAVAQSGVVHDANGTAVAIVLRNRTAVPQPPASIAIDVVGAHGASLFKNNAAGLDPTLTTGPVIPPHAEATWVNDQVTTSDTPTGLHATVGVAHGRPPGALPAIAVGAPKLSVDPVSGAEVSGVVTNRSKLEQRKLVIACVAWNGKRLLAAGRGEVQKLAPGKHAEYHVFLIGDPRGARLEVSAPPTVL